MANTVCPEATRHGIVNCPSRIHAGLGKPVRLADLKGGVHKAFSFSLKCIWPLVASTE